MSIVNFLYTQAISRVVATSLSSTDKKLQRLIFFGGMLNEYYVFIKDIIR